MILIDVVAEITELWVGNSHKINCRDVTSIREGTVSVDLNTKFRVYLRMHQKLTFANAIRCSKLRFE